MRPAYASQPQSIEFQYPLEVGKQHLHLLAIPARLRIGRRHAYSTCDFARLLVDASGDLAMPRVWAAIFLVRATRAALLTGAIDHRVGVGDMSARVRELAPLTA